MNMQPMHSQRIFDLGRYGSLILLLLLYLVFCFPLGCAVGASSGSGTVSGQSTPQPSVVPPQFFGMVVRHAASQPAIETGSRRLWDAGVTWAQLEPSKGTFVWTTLDAAVDLAQAAGQQITLTLGMTPAWASSEPSIASAYGNGATGPPASLADWDAYVAAVATRYAGRITAYQVWNAPEDTAYWSGSAAQLAGAMASLAAHTATQVHAADPKALVVAPSLGATGLAQFLAAGGAASIDVISTPVPLAGQAPEMLQASIQAVRAALANTSAAAKPLWNDQPAWTLPSAGLSEDDQAAYTARSLILNASLGVAQLSWYAWDENAPGVLALTDPASAPTKAAIAYGTAEGWLSGAAINGCSPNAEQLWTCQIVRNGTTAWILWSTTGTVSFSGLGMATVTNLVGAVQPVNSDGSVTIGESPSLLQ